MDNKFIVAKADRVARMRLFSEIDSEGLALSQFLAEFDSLQADDSIDTIEILINSLGGSVFRGFPIVTAIKNSTKSVTTIIDTVGASMGALIFLAGSTRKMYSYSQLMLHSASYDDGHTDTPLDNTNNNIYDFIKGITKKGKDKINKWLSQDTWFTAQQALENNLATAIIDSKMSLIDSYQTEVRQIFASASIDQLNNLKNKYSKIEMEEIFNELNLKPEASEKDVKAKIQEIKNALAIKEQELANRESKIQELSAKLEVFETKEKAEKEKAIEELIEAAFTNRQINAEGKGTWKSILSIDFENGKKAIQALTKTEKLSDIVNTDEEVKQFKYELDPIQQLMFNNK